jgi:peroxiredoxin
LRVLKLKDRYEAYHERELEVVAVFQSPNKSVAKYVMSLQPPFSVIADPEQKIYALYESRSSWWGMIRSLRQFSLIRQTFSSDLKPGKMEGTYSMLPSDFLIDEELKIARAFYAADITQHMPFDVIETFLLG